MHTVQNSVDIKPMLHGPRSVIETVLQVIQLKKLKSRKMLRKGKLNIRTSIRVLNMMMGFYAFFFLNGR